METYQSVIELIKKNSEIINFGEFCEGVSESWIKKAQDRLGCVFPPSYIWWLKNYAGGEIYGEEIFSIYQIDFDSVKGGDIVYVNELNRKNHFSNEKQIVIQETDRSEVFYFDLLKPDRNGEYPVYLNFANSD